MADKPFEVEFKNVSFSYPNSSFALRDISFRISAGERVAIVGENGAGKSTIVKLLLRLYDVQSGEILINGVNINAYNLFELRKALLKNKTLEVVVMGDSMYPVIHQQDVLTVEAVGEYNIGDIIVEMGLDSIKFIQIIVSLEEAFECEIPDEKLLLTEMNSVNKMFEVLQHAVNESDKSVHK